MKEFNCEKLTISDIKKKKQFFISTIETSGGAKRCKALKKEAHEAMEKATYLWFLQEHSEGTPQVQSSL